MTAIDSIDGFARSPAPTGSVYFISMPMPPNEEGEEWSMVKIGYSTNPKSRLAGLQTSVPIRLVMEATFRGTLDDERALHERFAADHIRGEWFRLTEEMYEYLDDLRDAQLLLRLEHGQPLPADAH